MRMKSFLDPRQTLHNPKHFMFNGRQAENPETPARIEILKAGAEAAGCAFEAPRDYGLGPIGAIHSPRYLTFLQNIYTRWARMKDGGDEVIPNIHPANRVDSYPASAVGQAGFHQADTACPISANTWEAAYWSAQSAIAGAEYMLQGGSRAYVLCRPPGHHAMSELAGGFCFLNNAAIAADLLSKAGRRVSVLDIDVHHGNGTQNIFYHRNDVFTVSLHADPARFYPFYWGHSAETGAGLGAGYNLNLPLPRRSDDADYLTALAQALEQIQAYGTDCLVVALGLDAYEGDPFQGLAVSSEGFTRIGQAISALGCPILLVQEGGYICPELGTNLTAAIAGFAA